MGFEFCCKLSVEAVLIETGRLFQSFGAATAKARSPLDFNLAQGTFNSLWLEDIRDLPGL